MIQQSACQQCNAALIEETDDSRHPCPLCGCMARTIPADASDAIAVHEHLRMKGCHVDESKFFFDVRTGSSYYRKGDEWHHLYRLIDRENDLYVETIKLLSTGEIINHVEESLSEHIGHGSDRHRVPSNEP